MSSKPGISPELDPAERGGPARDVTADRAAATEAGTAPVDTDTAPTANATRSPIVAAAEKNGPRGTAVVAVVGAVVVAVGASELGGPGVTGAPELVDPGVVCAPKLSELGAVSKSAFDSVFDTTDIAVVAECECAAALAPRARTTRM